MSCYGFPSRVVNNLLLTSKEFFAVICFHRFAMIRTSM